MRIALGSLILVFSAFYPYAAFAQGNAAAGTGQPRYPAALVPLSGGASSDPLPRRCQARRLRRVDEGLRRRRRTSCDGAARALRVPWVAL